MLQEPLMHPRLQLLLACQGHPTRCAQPSQFCPTIHLHLGDLWVHKLTLAAFPFPQIPLFHHLSLLNSGTWGTSSILFHFTTNSCWFNLLTISHIHSLLSVPMATAWSSPWLALPGLMQELITLVYFLQQGPHLCSSSLFTLKPA